MQSHISSVQSPYKLTLAQRSFIKQRLFFYKNKKNPYLLVVRAKHEGCRWITREYNILVIFGGLYYIQTHERTASLRSVLIQRAFSPPIDGSLIPIDMKMEWVEFTGPASSSSPGREYPLLTWFIWSCNNNNESTNNDSTPTYTHTLAEYIGDTPRQVRVH